MNFAVLIEQVKMPGQNAFRSAGNCNASLISDGIRVSNVPLVHAASYCYAAMKLGQLTVPSIAHRSTDRYLAGRVVSREGETRSTYVHARTVYPIPSLAATAAVMSK